MRQSIEDTIDRHLDEKMRERVGRAIQQRVGVRAREKFMAGLMGGDELRRGIGDEMFQNFEDLEALPTSMRMRPKKSHIDKIFENPGAFSMKSPKAAVRKSIETDEPALVLRLGD